MTGTVDSPDLSEWIYLKVYVGQAVDKVDGLLLETVPRILALEPFERWFFLRYLDEKGVHLRLRFRVPAGSAARLAGPIHALCERQLGRLAHLPPTSYRPMVFPTAGSRDADAQRNVPATVGIVADTYQPELEKFGGTSGMPIAEEVFESSSRIALAILADEVQGRFSRKTIAPCLMQVVLDSIAPGEDAECFWRNYSLYWLGGQTTAAEDWRRRFFEKGSRLSDEQIPIMWTADLPSRATALANEWREQLRRACNAYDQIENLGQVTADILAFNFAHLMNNRLGLITLEEAYLAALLEQRARGEQAA